MRGTRTERIAPFRALPERAPSRQRQGGRPRRYMGVSKELVTVPYAEHARLVRAARWGYRVVSCSLTLLWCAVSGCNLPAGRLDMTVRRCRPAGACLQCFASTFGAYAVCFSGLSGGLSRTGRTISLIQPGSRSVH